MLSAPLRSSGEKSIHLLKGGDLVVAGYASVEVVDKQGDKITKEALKDAFAKYMGDEKYRNVQLAHSNIQVGEVIPSYTDSEGRLWKSEVDDVGMFVVVALRDDIEKAKEVAAEIRKGSLRGFSIGGQAFKRVRKSDAEHGDYQEISKLELHEITICERGINPEATFRILKHDIENKEVSKMTDENDMMTQMTDVLSRLEGRLDAMEKGEMPPGLKEHMADKKGKDEDKKDDAEDAESKDESKKSEEYSDVITSEYLDWMEGTLKSAGVDIEGARAHFDGLEKANLGSTPEAIGDGADYFAGQVKGRAQEGGKPSTNALGKTTGSGKVEKGDFLTPDMVGTADVEAAYEVYKAAMAETELRSSLETEFANRYAAERQAEIAKSEVLEFDARGPLDEITKAISALGERIDSLTAPAESGTTIAKSETSVPAIDVPSTEDLGNMSWDEVHNLANSAFRSV
jgi:HK97 family phage prohead protease